MGQGSKAYFIYYLVASLVYLIIMSIGFAYSTQYTCNASCPMLIPVSNQGKSVGLDYFQCLCTEENGTRLNATGFATNDVPNTEDEQYKRWLRIKAITGTSENPTGRYCYICGSASSPTVYEVCPEYGRCTLTDLNGFRPASINSTVQCNTTPDPPFPEPFAYILQSAAVTNRQMVNILILVMSSLFAVMTLASLIIAYAYFRFKDKYDSDWGKLTQTEVRLGIMAKFLPNIARLANLFAMIFLIIGSKFFFSDRVCEYDENNVGAVTFYPTISGFLIAMIIVWLFFCFLGGCFHNTWPRDTSFYNPRFPEEPNQNLFVRLICSGWCVLTNFGP